MERGRIVVDSNFETSMEGVYAIGDVIKGIQLAHVASAQGVWVAEHLAGTGHSIDLSIVPSCVYTSPEIASVGLTEDEAAQAGIPVSVGKFLMSANGKSQISREERGFIKIIAEADTKVVLGAQMMCARATDMIGEMATAAANKLTVPQLLLGMRAHPTYNEAVGEALEELEGGSIHSDGEGTILTTESCLCSAGRNPQMTKAEITEKLCVMLGAEKVLWLPRGIYGDETNEHVDNVCAFTAPSKVVLAWTDNENDPQYALSKACADYLEQQTDAKGRKLEVTQLPIPQTPVCVTQEECDALDLWDGEPTRSVDERLAASYVNFYIANDSVLVPQFGDPMDKTACEILAAQFPTRKIIPIAAREILLGGGNIHCITQQIPEGRSNSHA